MKLCLPWAGEKKRERKGGQLSKMCGIIVFDTPAKNQFSLEVSRFKLVINVYCNYYINQKQYSGRNEVLFNMSISRTFQFYRSDHLRKVEETREN